jgi:hypothetical protein
MKKFRSVLIETRIELVKSVQLELQVFIIWVSLYFTLETKVNFVVQTETSVNYGYLVDDKHSLAEKWYRKIDYMYIDFIFNHTMHIG